MRFDPLAYWRASGSDPRHSEHVDRFRSSDVFARQEERLLAHLDTLDFGSVLEVGCGWGRITKLVSERFPDVPYVAFDLSPERVAAAMERAPGVAFEVSSIADFWSVRHADLVLCIEVLMHVPPDEIAGTVEKLRGIGHLVTVDWSEHIDGPIAPWNWRHDYEAMGLRRVETLGLQAIFEG